MKTHWITPSFQRSVALCRMGIGATFIIHGFIKLANGPEQWLWLGQQLSLLGIDFAPVFWGFLAAISEFTGGLFLLVGFFTRASSLMLASVMVIATIYSASQASAYGDIAYPVSQLLIFLALMMAPDTNLTHKVIKIIKR